MKYFLKDREYTKREIYETLINVRDYKWENFSVWKSDPSKTVRLIVVIIEELKNEMVAYSESTYDEKESSLKDIDINDIVSIIDKRLSDDELSEFILKLSTL